MTQYTENFEYATKLVRGHIDQEISLAGSDQETVFGKESWLSDFFNFNFIQLKYEDVVKGLESKFVQDGQNGYNTYLARVNALYIQMFMACGSEFMNELRSNCINSIASLLTINNRKKNNTADEVKSIFIKYPLLLIAAVGNDYFSSHRILYSKRSKMNIKGHQILGGLSTSSK